MRWWVDGAALRELCRLDGCYLLVTNDPTLSSVEMLRIYKDKDRIEKRFRIAKQVLRVRPIYLHKDERIEAMPLINMIALLVYSLAERRCRGSGLEITGRQKLYEFAPLRVVEPTAGMEVFSIAVCRSPHVSRKSCSGWDLRGLPC